MEHVDWLNHNNIVVVRTSIKLDTFLDDIKNKKCEQIRLLRVGSTFLIRYRISRNIYWYEIFLHKIDFNYYLTPIIITDKKYKEKLNRKYLKFNRDWILNELFK